MASPQDLWRMLGFGKKVTAPPIEEIVRAQRVLEGMRTTTEAERAWQLRELQRLQKLANDFDEVGPEAMPNLTLDELRRSAYTGGPKQSLQKELLDRDLGVGAPESGTSNVDWSRRYRQSQQTASENPFDVPAVDEAFRTRMNRDAFMEREIQKRSGGSSGFAARWDDQGRIEADEALRRSQQGSKAFIDRRMGEIGDQLIYLENQREHMKPEEYDSLRRALTNEYEQLNQRRLGVKKQARKSGTAGPDDAEGETNAIRELVQNAYRKGKTKAQLKKDLVDLFDQNQNAMRHELDDRTNWILDNYDQIDSEIQKLPDKMQIGKPGLGDAIDTMNVPSLDTGRYDLPRWAQNVKRIAPVLPVDPEQQRRSGQEGDRAMEYIRSLSESSQVPPGEHEPPELVRQAMGIGGMALTASGYLPEALPYTLATNELMRPVKPPIVQDGRFTFQPRTPRTPGRARAILEGAGGR